MSQTRKAGRGRLGKARLQAMIDEATVDCHDEEEAWDGFIQTVADEIECPFWAKILGEEVEVVGVTLSPGGNFLLARCRYKGSEHMVDLLSLKPSGPPPKGWEWVEAWLTWLQDRR